MNRTFFLVLVSILLLVFNSLNVFGQDATRGLGVIEVDAEYTTYRNVTRSREIWVPGGRVGTGASGSSSGTVLRDQRGYAETEYYTVREPVKSDYKISFIVLENGNEVFRGVTPIRVTNFNPGVTYTIIWVGYNGRQKEGTFLVPNTRPFTKYIHLE
jgi:hypothetical protein